MRSDLVALAARSGGAGMVGGQVIDLASEHADVDADLIARLETMKTGALIAFSTAAGGLLGQAGGDAVKTLETFGFELGLAFQITDDLLTSRAMRTILERRLVRMPEPGRQLSSRRLASTAQDARSGDGSGPVAARYIRRAGRCCARRRNSCYPGGAEPGYPASAV